MTTDAPTRSFGDKHRQLYASERDCARYDSELCCRQDHAGALLAAIRDVFPELGPSTCVADVGAGTGKIARLLAPHVGSVVVTDRSTEAISIARGAASASADGAGSSSCELTFHVADLRTLPLPDESVNLVVAGCTRTPTAACDCFARKTSVARGRAGAYMRTHAHTRTHTALRARPSSSFSFILPGHSPL
jgi:SAM-dependent methyltransferase